jgi:hypothetical protein
MLEQLRVNWIASPERKALHDALHAALAAKVAASFPTGIPAGMALELAEAALREVDAWLSKPVQAQAQTITIHDHRG